MRTRLLLLASCLLLAAGCGSSGDRSAHRQIQPCPRAGSDADRIVACLTADLQRFWRGHSARTTLTLRVLVADRRTDLVPACRNVWSVGTAFYCGGRVYLVRSYVRGLARQDGPRRLPYLLAVTLAHESGHRVATVTGHPPSPLIEQQADCLAGVWARDAVDRHRLDRARMLAAEREELTRLSHTVHSETALHGPVRDRLAAFRRGLAGRTSADCPLRRP